MKVIYANIVFFIIVLYGLVGAALIRLTSSFWETMDGVKTEYDLVSLICAVWLLVTIVGLILRKPWAYTHALSIDAVIAIVPIILLIIASSILWQEINHIETLKGIAYDLLFSAVSFGFWLTLCKSSNTRKAYNKSLNLIGANNAPPR